MPYQQLHVLEKTGLIIPSKSSVPPLFMANFEIEANNTFHSPLQNSSEVNDSSFLTDDDDVRNFTAIMANYIETAETRREVTRLRSKYAGDDEEILCKLVLSLLEVLSKKKLGRVTPPAPTVENLCSKFTFPPSRRLSDSEFLLVQNTFRGYREFSASGNAVSRKNCYAAYTAKAETQQF